MPRSDSTFHVLLIVESPDERAAFRQMLLRGSPRHYTFTEAESGHAGIRAVLDAPGTPPDCVLLDDTLRDPDAPAVLAALRAGGEVTTCPVVVITNSLERGTLALRAGAHEFFGNDWATPVSVTRAIDSAVDRHGSARGRVAAEAALGRNLELFSAIVDQAPGGVYVVDAQFRVVQMNAESRPFFASVQPLIGRDFDDALEIVWGPEVGPQIATIFRHTLATGERYVSPRFSAQRHDIGGEEAFEWEIQRITLPDGQHGVVCYFQDVTPRVRAETERRETERNYRALAAASSEIAYRMSADWSTMLPLDGRQLVPSTDRPLADWAWLHQNLPPDEHARVRQAINTAIAEKSLLEMEHRVRRPDGSIGWTLSRAVPILDASEEVTAWFGAASDITERKRAEEAVARLAAIVECSYDALLSEDLDGIVTSWNRAAEQLFGYGADEMIGTSILRLIPEAGHAAALELKRQILSGPRGGTFESTRRAKDGREFQASITISPMTDAAGTIIGTSRAIRDITERQLAADGLREAKEAAESANRSKDRFLAALSHELRTPLTPVLLVSEVHAKSTKHSAELREDFEMIHRNIVLEAQLIDDLLDVSRIQQGKMRFDFDLVDVHEGIARALEMLRSEIEEKAIAVQQELSATPATLEADSARLRQVLCNLLRNAVKFTSQGGTITVRTARESGALKISVTDTGAGIAAENLERIFQPFEQVDAQQKSEHRSLGLGLAISGAIVAAHRGRIWAESPGPGHGSTLHVRLPS